MHITFSTKNREQLIDKEMEKELFSYLAGICRNQKCSPLIVGGYKDHVHILCLLSRKIALMKLIEELKSHSSKWIKTKGEKYRNFYWQNGYGGFSVAPSQLDTVRNYIANQVNHHAEKTFQDEYRNLLEEFNIDFDERYVWD